VTDRKTASTINDTELDQLYNQLDRTRTALTELLNRFHPVPLPGYDGDRICHPITQREYETWRAALGDGPPLDAAAGRLAVIRASAARLTARGFDAMSARWILDTIDGPADQPARTATDNPATCKKAS